MGSHKKWLAALCGLLVGLSVASSAFSQSNCKVNDQDIAQSYVGGCKDGLAEGKGMAKGRDTYVGEFQKGYTHGKGTYTWQTGDRYEGDWVEGYKHGKGTFTWQTGDRYEGDWVKGKRAGNGIFTRPESNRNCSTSFCTKKYVGAYKGDKPTCGKTDFWNGDSHDGCFYENGTTMKGKTKFQLATNTRLARCPHVYAGRSVSVSTDDGWGLVNGVVVGFSAERGVASVKNSLNGEFGEYRCEDIKE